MNLIFIFLAQPFFMHVQPGRWDPGESSFLQNDILAVWNLEMSNNDMPSLYNI